MRFSPLVEIDQLAALDAPPLLVWVGFGFKFFNDVWVVAGFITPLFLQFVGVVAGHGCQSWCIVWEASIVTSLRYSGLGGRRAYRQLSLA